MSAVAAISQLVATGAIDSELTKNPTVTYFRYQHFRHTNFAIENQILSFGGNTNYNSGGTAECQLHRSGDLVNRLYVVVDLPGIANVATVTGTVANTYINTDLGLAADFHGSTPPAFVVGEAVEKAYVPEYMKKTGTTDVPFAIQENDTGSVNTAIVPSWCNAVGFKIIEDAALEIGSQTIDKVYSHYLYMWEELSQKAGKSIAQMIGKYSSLAVGKCESKYFRRLHVPLPFFHTRTTGASLPIVSLQFHSVKVKCRFSKLADLLVNGATGTSSSSVTATVGTETVTFQTSVRPGEESLQSSDASQSTGILTKYGSGSGNQTELGARLSESDIKVQVEAMYIYLDMQERSKFSSGSFQLLMSEAHTTSTPGAVKTPEVNIELDFNHAIIEILFAVLQKKNEDAHKHFAYGGVTDPVTGKVMDAVKHVSLSLNNSNRVQDDNNGFYFRQVQPYQHHSSIPDSHVYSYSFALYPESENPSGQCNFSRIDTKKLKLTLDNAMFTDNTAVGGADNSNNSCKVLIFARNWNLLRVTLGLAGKAFAN